MKLIFLFIIVAVLRVHVVAQQAVPVQTNSVVLSEMLDSAAQIIAQELQQQPFAAEVVGHPDSVWIQSIISNRSRNGTERIVITPIDVSVRYNLAEASDSVERVCSVHLQAELKGATTRVLRIPVLTQKRIVSRQSIVWLNDEQHLATRPVAPIKPRSIWDDILEPVVFVSAAVVTVVLLFTVRSK